MVKTELRDPTKRPRDRFFYVDVSSVDNEAFAIRQPAELLGADAPSRARKVIRERDVIFATVRPTLRRIALVDSAFDDQICSTGFCVLRPSAKLDAGFLYYWLLTDDVLEHVAKVEKGVSYPSVRDSDVKGIRIPYPPLDQQRQIAAVLSAVQRAMRAQARLIDLTAELKRALMHKLFSEGTRGEPLKETESGRLPQSWNPTPIGTCCDIVTSSMSYADFVCAAESTDSDAVPCMAVKVSDMNLPGNEATFVTANITKRLPAALATRKLVPPNTVVFPKRGAAIATNKKRLTTTWTALDPNLIAVRGKKAVEPKFLFYWSQTFDLRTITDPGPTPQLNKKDLIPVKLPLPSTLEEQRSMIATLDAVNAKWLLQSQTLASLSEFFRTLLQQLMTGQVRVHDLDVSALEETAKPAGAR